MNRWLSRLAPVAVLATGACVATRNDIRVLQQDLSVMRAEAAEAERARRAQVDSALALVTMTSDSLRALSGRLVKYQGDLRGELYAIGQQLIQVQELTGQSQRRLQELRASLDERAQTAAAAAGDTTAGQTPGPNQLFQLALDQLRRGSMRAARSGFQDLLQRYPTADVAGDAQFYVAESYATEGNAAAADSAYALVVSKYPQSSRAPTALYKRALAAQAAGNAPQARALLNQVVSQYPRSDEAELARERLRTLK